MSLPCCRHAADERIEARRRALAAGRHSSRQVRQQPQQQGGTGSIGGTGTPGQEGAAATQEHQGRHHHHQQQQGPAAQHEARRVSGSVVAPVACRLRSAAKCLPVGHRGSIHNPWLPPPL